jgi:MFS superfamily sulfate permease-like transporter
MSEPRGNAFALSLREANGALGDLGTLLPLMLGCIAVVGMPAAPVLAGFAVFYLASALAYRLPVPVQPMKAVAAVAIAAQAGPADLALAGVLVGLVLLLVGATGWIGRLARLVPQSVLAGLQLGLGLSLALAALTLMQPAPVLALAALAILALGLLVPRLPGVLLVLAAGAAVAPLLGAPGLAIPQTAGPPWTLALALPDLTGLERAGLQLALPQLSLTLTNAVVLTALLAGDYFGPRAAHVTPVRLSLTSGLANLVLTPFGALPMCHGAGGLAAHHRFGARSGTAPLLLGLALLALALLPGALGPKLLAAIPAAALGALLLWAAGELALGKRLFDARPSCWPVIAVTAAVTLWADPFAGLLAGSLAEAVRLLAVRRLFGRRRDRSSA